MVWYFVVRQYVRRHRFGGYHERCVRFPYAVYVIETSVLEVLRGTLLWVPEYLSAREYASEPEAERIIIVAQEQCGLLVAHGLSELGDVDEHCLVLLILDFVHVCLPP